MVSSVDAGGRVTVVASKVDASVQSSVVKSGHRRPSLVEACESKRCQVGAREAHRPESSLRFWWRRARWWRRVIVRGEEAEPAGHARRAKKADVGDMI
jgi:hypothetical protein